MGALLEKERGEKEIWGSQHNELAHQVQLQAGGGWLYNLSALGGSERTGHELGGTRGCALESALD